MEKHVIQYRDSVEWVNTPEEATADYLPSAQETQRRVKDELGIETVLVEIRDEHLMQSKWVISKQ